MTYTGSATDKQEGTLPVTFSPASGGMFPLGMTTVNATASDLNGNVGNASFTVNVVDTTLPVLTVPGNLMAEATGPAGAPVTFMGSAQDTVSGNLPVMFNPPSGSTFPLGATLVTATATDAAGNMAIATFTVNIADTTPPVLSGPGNLVAEASGPAGAAVNFSGSAQDSVSGSLPMVFHPASGSVFPMGVTSVTGTATDAAGNTASTTFTVTVGDTTAPVIRSLTATPDRISPPNHKMVPITLRADVSDVGDAHPQTKVIAVKSSQADDARCDGHTSEDFKIDGPMSVQVRAERAACEGDRVYTITVESRDASGNASTRDVTVTVPKSGH